MLSWSVDVFIESSTQLALTLTVTLSFGQHSILLSFTGLLAIYPALPSDSSGSLCAFSGSPHSAHCDSSRAGTVITETPTWFFSWVSAPLCNKSPLVLLSGPPSK